MIYLDHNATTPVRPEVLEAMLPYLKGEFGNPNSAYVLGQRARAAVESAREKVAAFLGARDAQEIVFTSCGSESDVLAIAGGAQAADEGSKGARRHVVSSKIEHDAVRGVLGLLRRRGFAVDAAGVDADGLVSPAEVGRLLKPSTALVSVMHANNEVGTVQPVAEIAALCRERGVLFHTDAVQSAGKVPLDVVTLGADMLSISGHKLNAPKGVGALYVRKGARLSPVITGHQEKSRRGGTENVASIAGLGVACELAAKDLAASAAKCAALFRTLVAGVLRIPGARLNGHPERRLPNCAHFSFPGLDGHQLVVALDLEGICVSSGPACSSGAAEPSHVLAAMGVAPEVAVGSIRVSWGWGSTEAEVAHLVGVLPRLVERLRRVAVPAKP